MKTFWNFLSHADGHHPGTRRLGEVGLHHVSLAIALLEAHHRDVFGLGEVVDGFAEGGADLVEQRRGGDLVAAVLAEESDHLPADLEVGDVGVQVHPVQALDVEGDVAVQEIVDVRDTSHRATST